MINRDKIEAIVEEKIAGTDIYIVDVSVSSSNKILVLVDTDAGITVEECINLSRHIENSLDRELEDFELEVSSPGLSQPFKVHRQYMKNIGREVSLVTNDNSKVKGKLLSVSKDGIELETLIIKKDEKKKKVSEKIVVQLDFEQIKSTKVVISF
jgi:ribosome maturation factor RimP